MLIQSLKKIFRRDLELLRSEIEQYKTESQIWVIDKQIANTAGNLCLHLVGNLNTFIGTEFGKTGYVRNRELEFSLKNLPREELIQKVNDTINVIDHALDQITEKQLGEEYPKLVLKEKTTTEFFLVHLATHLTYHLGQINYHRRLLDK